MECPNPANNVAEMGHVRSELAFGMNPLESRLSLLIMLFSYHFSKMWDSTEG